MRAGRSAKAAAADSVSGSGFPLVSGRNGAATTPRMKNEPTIVAAGEYTLALQRGNTPSTAVGGQGSMMISTRRL